jgi:hypothetical protein
MAQRELICNTYNFDYVCLLSQPPVSCQIAPVIAKRFGPFPPQDYSVRNCSNKGFFMTAYVSRAGLQVSPVLAEFVENRAIAGTGVGADRLWQGLADILAQFGPRNQALLAKRDDIQAKLDDWHTANPGPI